jgi:multiple sugar transport system substrate-binding protein
MAMKLRQITTLLLLVLLVPIVAACGSQPATQTSPEDAQQAPAADSQQEAPAPAEVSFTGATAGANGNITAIQVEDGATLRFVAPANATEQQLYLEGAARFQELFPSVTVNFEPINDQYLTTMIAEFTAQTGPDVLLVDGEVMGNIGANGLLLPLDEYMQQAGAQVADYVDPLIELYQQDGQTYAIPKDFNPLVVFINTEMAAAANVDPTSIQTWDDLKQAAAAMTQGEGAGKTYGMCLNPDILRYGAAMFQNGNPIIENNQAVFDQSSGVEALEFWYSFKDEGTGELYAALGRGWCGEAFGGRSTAMAVEGGWMVPFLADPAQGATDLQYTAIPLPIPAGGEQATWLFTNGIGANGNTQYPNAAAALAIFLTSAANQQALIPSGLAQPSLKALADDPYYQENAVAKVLVDQAQYGRLADTVLGGPLLKGDIINTINQEGIEPLFLGAMSAAEALSAAAAEVNQLLQE